MKSPRSAFFRLSTLLCMTLLAAALVACGNSSSGSGTSTLAITASSPPTGSTGVAYAGYTFDASGGAPPLSWTETGSLPPGLAFNASGQLSGKPTTAGTYAFSVRVSDSSVPPLTANTSVGLKINDSAIVIAPATPPAGTVTYPYRGFTFTASGGSPPYTWKASGTLPPGLVLGSNGTLSGTPTQAGSFAFLVTATDSAQTPMSSSALASQIKIGTALVIDNQEAPTGTVGVSYPPFGFSANNGLAPLAWSETPLLAQGLTLSKAGVLSGTPNTAGQFPITLEVTDAFNRSASVQTTVRVSLARPPATFLPVGSLGIPRSGHTATLLSSGDVLVTGGGSGGPDATAELYSPLNGGFTRTAGNMTEARSGHTATLLGSGKVLIVGSVDTTAELYDPVRSMFATTGSLHHPRTSPTATLLVDTGEVLIVGGNTDKGDQTAELYDPVSGEFVDTGRTTIQRTGHSATLLSDGRVLIAGGTGAAGATAELYDPSAHTFTPTSGSMTRPRFGHTATLLEFEDGSQSQNGSVLVIGTDGSADLYNPSTQTFASVGSLQYAVSGNGGFTATLRNDGTVLVAGGYINNPCNSSAASPLSLAAAASFAAESDGFTVTGGLNTARDMHTATLLYDGSVLVIGGTLHTFSHPSPNSCQPGSAVLSSAEVFKTPGQRTYTLTGYCYGAVSNAWQMCGIAKDTTQCPVGQPAVRPTWLECSSGGQHGQQPVDGTTSCRVVTSTNPWRWINGACLIQ